MSVQPERDAATFAAVEAVLGDMPVEFATAGDLAALMVRLPPGTPVSVATHIRVDPDLDMDHEEERTAFAATVVGQLEQQPGEIGPNDGHGHLGDRRVATIELCAYYVAEQSPVPQRTVPYDPYNRGIEAVHTGNVGRLFDAHLELLNDVAGTLDGRGDATLTEGWITDNALRDELAIEANRLRQSIARIEVLRAKVVAHLNRGTGDDGAEPVAGA
jgi:hypothetical protein